MSSTEHMAFGRQHPEAGWHSISQWANPHSLAGRLDSQHAVATKVCPVWELRLLTAVSCSGSCVLASTLRHLN